MSERAVSYSQAVSLPDPADRVWDILLRFDEPRLYGDITADIEPSGPSSYKGTVFFGDTELQLSAKPYDIKMSSDGLRIGFRVKPAGQICTVLAACSCSDDSPHRMDRSDLTDLLTALETILREEYPLPSDEPEAEDLTPPDEPDVPEELPLSEDLSAPEVKPEAETVPTAQELSVPEEPSSDDEQPVTEDLSLTEDLSVPEKESETETVPTAQELSVPEEPVPAEELPAAEDLSLTEEVSPPEEDPRAETVHASQELPAPAEPVTAEEQPVPEIPQSEVRETTVRIEETLPVPPSSSRRKRRSRHHSGKRHERKSGKKTGKIAAALLLIALAVVSAVFVIKYLGKPGTPSVPETNTGSESVTLQSALSARPGDSRSEIEALLGSPSSSEGGISVYRSSSLTDYGTPSVAVQVVYEGEKASRITVLDLERASAVGEVTGEDLSGASSAEELDGLAGTTPSMIRSYLQGGDTVTEHHYGYLDPRMNFSPLWKGQLWASSVSGSIKECGTGYAYDGIDPLFHSEMTGTVLAQYSSYDDYLSDFMGFIFCLGMRSQPGRDETMTVIPSLTESGNADETTLYRGTSDELMDDGQPVWAYTMGFGTRGDFVLFSAVNRRLWEKEGMLNASAQNAVHSGMPFTEAMRCMRILPSMIYIDYSYITLGFGRHLQDTDVLTEQFEFCLRFTLTDNILESVYDNTGTHLDMG